MSCKARSLGCDMLIRRGDVHWSLPRDKAAQWIAIIDRALGSRRLTAAAAASLQGKLNFGCSRIFGRVGRAKMRPIACVAAQRGSSHVSRRLENALKWWRRYLATLPSSTVSVASIGHEASDFIVYSDAEKDGHIGVVLVDVRSGAAQYAQGKVPRRLRRMLKQRKTQINLYELLAVVCAWETFGQQLAGHRVTVFIDNQCAMNMLIKGWSRADDANDFVDFVWLKLAMLRAEVLWLYVPSKLNIADGPSRRRLDEVMALGAQDGPGEWPSVHSLRLRQ